MEEFRPSFSQRHGFGGEDTEITIREDAPEAVRDAVLMLAYACDLGSANIRDEVCKILLKRPDPNNWSASNIENEVHHLIDEAPWYKIYEIAENLYLLSERSDFTGMKATEYERRLNESFRELGVGWKMIRGRIEMRGSEAFTLATQDAVETMRQAHAPTAASEIHEALRDISRRPTADITGAIQHAMAALECVAREVDGSGDTLGQIINRLSLPAPLDVALHRLWGFTSQQGRHIHEGREPRFEEAELVVTVASAVSVYLLRRHARSED